MLSVSALVLKYEKCTDEELYGIYLNIDTYSNEAQEAFNIVLKANGGLEPLLKRIEEKQIVENEIKRIANETVELGREGVDSSFIKTTTSSSILSEEKVKEIIDSRYAKVELELEDKKINPRTIVGSVIGGGIASIAGGVLWGVQLIYTNRIFVIIFIGIVLLCYGIIKVATKQSKKNNAVFVATVISILLAICIGQLLYEIIGYKGS